MPMKENTEAASNINVVLMHACGPLPKKGEDEVAEGVAEGVVASDAPDGTAAPSLTQHVAVRANVPSAPQLSAWC